MSKAQGYKKETASRKNANDWNHHHEITQIQENLTKILKSYNTFNESRRKLENNDLFKLNSNISFLIRWNQVSIKNN